MVINHLIAPFVSPWLMIATGEPARHFLTMAFMDRERFRPDGYRQHAQKLTFYLVIVSLCVAIIQWLSGITTLLQMPLAWIALVWLRPWIFSKPGFAAALGISLWIGSFLLFLELKTSIWIPEWISGLNLFATALVFPFASDKITAKGGFPQAIAFASLYGLGSLTSILLGATSQLDLILVGLPLLLTGVFFGTFMTRPWLPAWLTRHSLSLYVLTLAFAIYAEIRLP
jgi:hypothetical protein